MNDGGKVRVGEGAYKAAVAVVNLSTECDSGEPEEIAAVLRDGFAGGKDPQRAQLWGEVYDFLYETRLGAEEKEMVVVSGEGRERAVLGDDLPSVRMRKQMKAAKAYVKKARRKPVAAKRGTRNR